MLKCPIVLISGNTQRTLRFAKQVDVDFEWLPEKGDARSFPPDRTASVAWDNVLLPASPCSGAAAAHSNTTSARYLRSAPLFFHRIARASVNGMVGAQLFGNATGLFPNIHRNHLAGTACARNLHALRPMLPCPVATESPIRISAVSRRRDCRSGIGGRRPRCPRSGRPP